LAHVLIDNHPRYLAALAPLLDSWGVTYAVLPTGEAAGAPPTVDDCDAVIRFRDGERRDEQSAATGPLPETANSACSSPPARCLVVAADPASGGGFRLTEAGAQPETALREALFACRDASVALRCDSADNHRGPHLRERLSHELRTPLTAIKTALEILAGDTCLDDDSQRMVDIALRNVDRLEDSVAWGEELLAAGLPDAD